MQSVEGHPTKRAAIAAMWNADVATAEIARRCDTTVKSVLANIHKMRKQGKTLKSRSGGRPQIKEAPASSAKDTRGIWTPEKLDKARRLFGKTMVYIADALQVPAKELLEFGLKGVIPPMGKPQRVAQLLEDRRQEPPIEEDEFPPPAGDEPSRDDDEAELLQLEEATDEEELTGGDGDRGSAGLDPDDGGPGPAVAPSIAGALRVAPRFEQTAEGDDAEEEAPPATEPPAAAGAEKPRRYRLTDGAGRYLLDPPEKGMTLNRALAWSGSAADMELLFKRLPALKDLDPERVP